MTRVIKLANRISDLKFVIAGLVVLICGLFPLCSYYTLVGFSQIEFITPVLYSLVLLLTLMFIEKIISIKNYSVELTPVDTILIVYMLYIGIGFALQYRTVNTETFIEFITLVILYPIFRGIKINFYKYLLLLFPLAGLAQIYYGIANQTQYFMPGFGFVDITGVFNNTGIMGGFMAIVFVATLGLPIKNTDSRRFITRIPFLKILRISVLFLFFIQLVASHSRAAWCACLAGCAYFIAFRREGIVYRFVRLQAFRKLLVGIIISMVVIALLVGLYTVRKDSADGRLLIWNVSVEMVKDKPIFGHGINGFQANYMEYQARYFTAHPYSPFSKLANNNHFAFNEVLKLLVEHGIVGLLLLGALGYVLFIKTPTNSNEAEARERAGIKAALVALFVFGCFSYPTNVFQFNVILLMLIALAPHNLSEGWTLRLPFADFFEKRNGVEKVMLRAGLLMVFISVVTIFIPGVLRYNTTCRNWDKGLKAFSNNQSYSDIKLLRSCYPELSNNGVFLCNYGKALTLSGAYTEAIPILIKANTHLPLASNYMELGKCYRVIGNTAQAKEAWIRASLMIPSLFTPPYLIAKMEYEIGKLPEARNLAKKLLEKKPKIRSPETDSIRLEMARLVEATNYKSQ